MYRNFTRAFAKKKKKAFLKKVYFIFTTLHCILRCQMGGLEFA